MVELIVTALLYLFLIPAVLLFLSRYLHENAHYIVLKKYFVKAKFPKFNFFSVNKGSFVEVIDNDAYDKLEWKRKVCVSLAGLITDFLLSLIFLTIYYYFKVDLWLYCGLFSVIFYTFIGTLAGRDRVQFLKAIRERNQ